MSNLIFDDWVFTEDVPPMGSPPMSTPGGPSDPMGQGIQNGPPGPPGQPQGQQPGQQPGQQQPDVTEDPQQPDMPDGVQDQEDDFEVWKNKYHKESIKGNITILLQLLNSVRDGSQVRGGQSPSSVSPEAGECSGSVQEDSQRDQRSVRPE